MTALTQKKETPSARELVTRAESMYAAVRSDPDVPLSVIGVAKLLTVTAAKLLKFSEQLEQLSEDVEALGQKPVPR